MACNVGINTQLCQRHESHETVYIISISYDFINT